MTNRDDDAAAVARRIVASVLAEHGVDDDAPAPVPGGGSPGAPSPGEASEDGPAVTGGARTKRDGTRHEVADTEARRTARRIVAEALAAAGIASAEPAAAAEVAAMDASAERTRPGGDAAEAGSSAGRRGTAVAAGPPPVPTPAQRIAHRIVQDALAAAEARRQEEAREQRERAERERREAEQRAELAPTDEPATGETGTQPLDVIGPDRSDAAASPGEERSTDALPSADAAASPGDESSTDAQPAAEPASPEPVKEAVFDIPVAPPQARPTVDVDGPAVARRLVADVLTARRERAAAGPVAEPSTAAPAVGPDARSSLGGSPVEVPSDVADHGDPTGPPPPPAAAFRTLRRDLGIHDEPTAVLEQEERPPRRTGRWLLATILGAIALALLFPLTVAAVRALISLSVAAPL